MAVIATTNPATGETVRIFTALSDDEIRDRLDRAAASFASWRKASFGERAGKMLEAASILEDRKDQLARTMTLEMGKTVRAAREEAMKCAWVCRFYAENAERFLADEIIPSGAARSYVRFQPLGPVLAVMPWNFPFWQVFRFAAPALMAGNVGVLKHAANVPQCSLAIEDVFRSAGFPDGIFQALLIGSAQVPAIIEDPAVAAVTLTGSVGAGSAVASVSGKFIKKTVLELGGSDPFIVMPDADLEKAVETAVRARIVNNGQSCIAAKRFIVAKEIAEEFESRFVARMESLHIGDPMDEATELGPLATREGLDDLDEQVRQSIAAGARLLTGGRRIPRPGYYYSPTVLADIPKAAPAYTEEIFGPVASIFRVSGAADAVRLANDTIFGLGASVWTNDQREKDLFINEIEAGQVFVNGMVASDPRLPFGGVKRSGYGRELSVAGIREFVNAKTVWIG